MNRVVFLLVIVIVLSCVGCSSSDIEEQLGPIKESERQDEIDVETEDEVEATLNLLVEYALNNIDFQFVSDTGRYSDYNEVSKTNYSNENMIDDIHSLSRLIMDQEFSALRKIILDVPDYNHLMREVKINYIIPILMHENRYHDALRIVYKKEEVEIEDDRFLFDIIYLMRYMYVNNSLEHAIEVVDQLKEEYPNENISYVWFAISPRQFELLNDKGIVSPPKEDSDRNKLWHYLASNYPDDPHIDYAYYFLGDYQKIIDDYPNSKLFEKAQYARADEMLRVVLHDIYSDNDKLDRGDLAVTKDYYKEYLQTYPDSEYSYRAVSDITYLCDIMYFNYGEDDHYFDFINAIMDMEFSGNYYGKRKIVDSILYSAKYNFKYSESLIEISEKGREFLEDEDVSSSMKYYIWSGLANNAFYKGELELADGYFNNIEKQELDRIDLYKLIVLSELKPLLGKNDSESLFEMAEILRSHEEYYASVYIYNKLAKMKLSAEELSKVLMLKASSSNKNRVYDEMLESYEYIVQNLDTTDFADDALAEIGVYYLLVEKEYEKAREIFRKVIKKYPETNAINNSYNWIAWSYLEEEDYENALVAYEELKDKFPTNRFGRNAIPNIKKIEEVLEAGDYELTE